MIFCQSRGQRKTVLDRPNCILDYPAMRLLREFKSTFKESGFKGVTQKYGWKLFIFIFVYYLVRDVTLYVVLPYLIFKGFAAN